MLHTLQNLSSTSRVRSILFAMTEVSLGKQPPTLLRRHAAGTDSPRSDRGDEVRQILAEAGLPDGYLFTAEHQGGGSLGTMVGQAWDLDQLTREYDEFIGAFSGQMGSDPLVRVIDLVHAWRRFPWIDPGLPA